MVKAVGIELTCRECGRQFVFTEGEQEFYDRMGFTLPSRCRECRSGKEKQNGQVTCAECGIRLSKGAPVYCENCFSSLQPANSACSQCGTAQGRGAAVYCEACLNRVQLDSERRVEKYKKAASSAESKLQVVESQNEELKRSLYELKQYVAELELKIKNLHQDLGKAREFQVASAWLKPALDSIAERLKALEQAERETNHRVAITFQKMQEITENVTLWEVIKRSFTPGKKQSLALDDS